jgi:endoglucanase
MKALFFIGSFILFAFPIAAQADLPAHLRGCNAEVKALSKEAAGQLADWKCNAVRVVIDANPSIAPTDDNPLAPYKESLDKLKEFLPAAGIKNITVIVCLGKAYGRSFAAGYWGTDDAAKQNRAYIPAFWKAFATTFQGEAAIGAYDLLDTPQDISDHSTIWLNELLPATVAAVRSVNTDIWLIAQPGHWGSAGGFGEMTPVRDGHTMYGYQEMYPTLYVYQGISAAAGKYRGKINYPGEEPNPGGKPDPIVIDRGALLSDNQPAITFATNNHVRVIVLSFAVARWAPGSAIWTGDMISIFENNHFDWMYGAMFGYSGANPTYGPSEPDTFSTIPGTNPTSAFDVLLKAWAKNSPDDASASQ